MSDLMRDLESEAADVSSIPSDDSLTRARRKAQELVDAERLRDELEQKLRDANVRLWDLKMREVPDLFAELGVDSLGLPGAGVDVEIGPYCKANISADWDTERREAGFEHLDALGAGDIVKNTITVTFPRGHDAERAEWLERVRGLNFSFEQPELVEARFVPWNTLTAFVKEQVQRGNTDLDLEKLGAQVGTIAIIKKRK